MERRTKVRPSSPQLTTTVEPERDVSLAATGVSNGEQRDDGSPIAAIDSGGNNPDRPTGQGVTSSATTDQNATPQGQGQTVSATAASLIMVPLCLAVAMSALDLTIVTPAIPAMVSAFQAESGYVWIGSAFILANTVSTPVWGSVADIWGRKPIMLISVAIFLAGSLLCALAPHIDALVTGRAVQGLGASGMGTMVNVIICDTFSLRDRGLYLAITSVVWAIASAVGPVVGGVFTTTLR